MNLIKSYAARCRTNGYVRTFDEELRAKIESQKNIYKLQNM